MRHAELAGRLPAVRPRLYLIEGVDRDRPAIVHGCGSDERDT
ncbi:MAG: hypothetical protein R3300_18585 [Candidatus Promineifilaceae bacterium]|nr:hypothetical protein [Candidatus Promineifilaceae bacterium]